jgi:hypothetical protein
MIRTGRAAFAATHVLLALQRILEKLSNADRRAAA